MSQREILRPGKRRWLSAAEKLAAIRRVRDGESKAAVGRALGVPESTLRGWCKSEDKIRSQLMTQRTLQHLSSPTDSDRRTLSGPSGSNLAVAVTQRDSTNEDQERAIQQQQQQRQQQEQQQLQLMNLLSVRNCLAQQLVENVGNDNNDRENDNETGNIASANTDEREPDLTVIINYMESVINWLNGHGSAVCTFRQLSEMRKVHAHMKEYLTYKTRTNRSTTLNQLSNEPSDESAEAAQERNV